MELESSKVSGEEPRTMIYGSKLSVLVKLSLSVLITPSLLLEAMMLSMNGKMSPTDGSRLQAPEKLRELMS